MSVGLGKMEVQTKANFDVAEVDECFLTGDHSAIHNQLTDVAKKFPDDRVREFARFAAREVAVKLGPHGEEIHTLNS